MKIRLRYLPIVLTSLVLVATLGLKVGVPTSKADVSSTLHASVGPDFQISLTFDDGTRVTQLPAGTYTVLVNDQGTEHNFHLFGPGVDLATSIESTEQATWTVTFADATVYQFHCDRHPNTLNGAFNSGNVPVATTPAPAPTPATPSVPTTSPSSSVTTHAATAPVASFVGTLTATVASNGAIGLTKSGKPVTRLVQGSYHLVIVDSGKRDGLTVRQIAGAQFSQAFTTASFVGRKTSSITLTTGQWKVYSTSREAATARFFRVTN